MPGYIVGESELEASKEGRNLSDFKYSCVGYSVFLENGDDDSMSRENQAELPFCVGIEVNILTHLLMVKYTQNIHLCIYAHGLVNFWSL